MAQIFSRVNTVNAYNTAFTNYINSNTAPIPEAAKQYLTLNPYSTPPVTKEQDTQLIDSIFTEIENKLPDLIPPAVNANDLWETIKEKIKQELIVIDNPDYPTSSTVKYLIANKP